MDVITLTQLLREEGGVNTVKRDDITISFFSSVYIVREKHLPRGLRVNFYVVNCRASSRGAG